MISVVIVNYNGLNFAEKLTESLENQSLKYSEVVIVDNNSTDNSENILFKNLKKCVLIKFKENMGFAYAVNMGVKSCSYDKVILLNNDVKLDADFIRNADKNLSDYENSFFAPLVLDYNGHFIDSAGDFVSKGFKPVKRLSGEKADIEFQKEIVAGFSMSVSYFFKKDFISVGMLDEKYFMYFEDVDFSLRALERQYKILFTPDTVAYHYISACTKNIYKSSYSPPKTFWESRNRVWTFFKNVFKKNPLRLMEFIYGTFTSFIFHVNKTGYWEEYLRGILHSVKDFKK